MHYVHCFQVLKIQSILDFGLISSNQGVEFSKRLEMLDPKIVCPKNSPGFLEKFDHQKNKWTNFDPKFDWDLFAPYQSKCYIHRVLLQVILIFLGGTLSNLDWTVLKPMCFVALCWKVLSSDATEWCDSLTAHQAMINKLSWLWLGSEMGRSPFHRHVSKLT